MPTVQAGEDVIEFPDSMSQEDIQSALHNRYRSVQKQGLSEQMQQARLEGNRQTFDTGLISGLEQGVGTVAQMSPLNLLKRTIEIPGQLAGDSSPLVPAVSPELARKAVDFFDPTISEMGSAKEGLKQFAADTISSLSTPDQVAALVAGKAAPELVARQFQTQMASSIPAAAQQLQQALSTGDKAEIARAGAGLVASAGLPAVIEKGIRSGEPRLMPKEEPVLEQAPPAAVTEGETPTAPAVSQAKAPEVAPSEAGPAIPPASTPADVSQVGSVTTLDTEANKIGQGPGARTFTPTDESAESYEGTALKNAVADVERAAHGLPEATPAETRVIAESWIKAADRLEQNHRLGSTLVDELKKNPDRGLDDIESMVLLRHKVDIENAINDAAERTNTSTDPVEKAQAQSEFTTATANLNDFLDAVKARGTSAGREFRLRQVLAKQDYTLGTMAKRFKAERNGGVVDEEVMKEIRGYQERIAETEKRATEAEAKATQMAAERAAEAEINRITLEEARRPKYAPRIIQIAENFAKAMDDAGAKALERLKTRRQGMTSGGIDPADIDDLAIYGASKLTRGTVEAAKWAAEMVSEVGEWIRPKLDEIRSRAESIFNKEADKLEKVHGKGTRKSVVNKIVEVGEKQAEITDKIKAKLETHRLDEVKPLVDQLVKSFSHQGLRGWRAINDAVHGVLKQFIPDLDYRETMDAVSGHGRFRVPSQAEADIAARDAKAQTNQIRKIQEVISKQPVKPTGFKRDLPSNIQRRLTQIYENAKRRFGVVITDPATQLRSALQSRKSYYTHRMSDLEAEIASRQRIVKNRALPPTDPELENLITQYKEVKARHDEVFGDRQLTDAQRTELESKSLDKQIAEVERQLKEGDIFPKGKTEPFRAKANEAKRANLEALKAEREYLRDSINPPSTPEETEVRLAQSRLKALESRLKRDTANRLDRMARGDFSKPVKRPPPVLSPEVMKARDENLKVREQWEKRLIQERLKNRSPAAIKADMAVQWARAAKLISFKVYPKLLNAALGRAFWEPLGRLAGQPLRLIAPDIYHKARVESGMSVKSTAKFWSKAVSSWAEAYEKLKTGSTDIDRILKKNRVKPDADMLSYVGNSHGMFKEPLRQATFESAKQLAAERFIRENLNPDEPLNTTQILSEAAEAADRNIFANPSQFTKAFIKIPQAYLRSEPFAFATSLARTMEFLMPIVNVPANIALHSMRLNPLWSIPEFTALLYKVRKKGFATTAEAEHLARVFKLGSLGTVMAAYAWTHQQNFGGIYEEGTRKKGAMKAGEVNLFGWHAPAWAMHMPEMMWMNTIASARRVYDRYVEKHHDEKTQAKIDAAAFATFAPVKNMPVIDAYVRTFGEDKNFGRVAGAMIRDAIVPGAATQVMKYFDKKERAPKTLVQEVEMGIPGLRQNVPEKKQQ